MGAAPGRRPEAVVPQRITAHVAALCPGTPVSDWWTYRPPDLLLFPARTYYRLFEIHNAALWPAQAAAFGLSVVLLWLAWQGGRGAARGALAIVAAGWLCSAGPYFWVRYATINSAAVWFAAAFAIEAALLLSLASSRACPTLQTDAPSGRLIARRAVGAVLVLAGIAYPAAAPLLGRPWTQAEVFGLAPDPTAIGTLGVLLLLEAGRERRLPGWLRAAWLGALWTLPVVWCLITGMTLWTLHATGAIIAPATAALALLATRLREPRAS